MGPETSLDARAKRRILAIPELKFLVLAYYVKVSLMYVLLFACAHDGKYEMS